MPYWELLELLLIHICTTLCNRGYLLFAPLISGKYMEEILSVRWMDLPFGILEVLGLG